MMKILAKILPAVLGGLLLAGVGGNAATAAADAALLVDWKPRGGDYRYGPSPHRYRGPPPRHYRGPPPRAYYAPPPVYYAPPPVYYAPPPRRHYRPAPPPGVGLYFRF